MSERTVYAIASGKGGVGKTTTAINLGAMLADRDHSVVIVDTDLGMANLADFLDFEIETPTLPEVLADDADVEEAVYRAPGGIDVLPSATDIEAFTKSDPGNLQDVVAPLREEYDYVLLDTGAGVSYDTLVPLALADAVLLVATPDVASVRDTAKTGELAERVESEVAGAVLTQRSSDILNADDVEETLGTDVLAVVPQDEAVPMGIDAGRPLAAFAPNAPAGQAYRDLAAVVTGDADPDPELDLGGDADVALDAEGENALADEELAENVRDAIGSDESGGLLGGQLATAAEEIRDQTADRAAADAGGGSPNPADGRTADETDEIDAADATNPADAGAGNPDPADAGAGDPDPAGETDEGEARSVDDLIEEHMGDDRLGDDPFGDDPSGDDLFRDDDSPDDEDAAPTGMGSEHDESSHAGEGSGNPLEDESAADAASETEEETDTDAVPFEGGGEPPNAAADDGDAEPSPVAGAGSGGVETGDAEPREPEDVKTGTLADEDDDGILGRIGSLFR